MKLTSDTIKRLNLESVVHDLIDCWAYKVTGSGEGSNGIFIFNHSALDYEPFPDGRCRVYNIKMIQQENRTLPIKVAVFFDATIDFINDADLFTIEKLLDDIPWPKL